MPRRDDQRRERRRLGHGHDVRRHVVCSERVRVCERVRVVPRRDDQRRERRRLGHGHGMRRSSVVECKNVSARSNCRCRRWFRRVRHRRGRALR